MARICEYRMCIGCGHFDTDPEAQQYCHAGCDGCHHIFEPFLEIDGKLVPIEPETKGERMIRLVHELGVEDLDIPMIGRPSGELFSQTRVIPSDECRGGCNNTGWQEGTEESGFICDVCDRACSCVINKYECIIHRYDQKVGDK